MPHVLIVVVDALRADHVGCYTGTDRGTPAMDRIAAEGVRFANAVAQASSTRPSVASLMTGRYPTEHTLADRWPPAGGRLKVAALDASLGTLAEAVAATGYETAAFVAGNANLKPVFGLMRGFSTLAWKPAKNGTDATRDLVRWIADPGARHTLGYLHLMDVHSPLPTETIPSRLDRGIDVDAVGESVDELLRFYEAGVRAADRHVGTVLDALSAARRLDDTLVILTADHGEELMEQGRMLSHGGSLQRKLVHVPLVMRFPRGAHAGTVVDRPAQLVDVMPTVLEHLGVAGPEVSGTSLLGAVRGEAGGPAFAFSQLVRPAHYMQAVTSVTHEYVERYDLEDTQRFVAADLRPGLVVSVKGRRMPGGALFATRMSLERDDDDEAKIHAPVEHVSPSEGSLTVLGLTFTADLDTEFAGREDAPLALADLAPGDMVALVFAQDGRRVRRIKRKGEGGKTNLHGVIEAVREVPGGHRAITVHGIEVLVADDLEVKPPPRRGEHEGPGPLTRILAGDVVERRQELYALDAPGRDVLDVRPDVAQDLETVLASWMAALEGGERYVAAEAVEVDPETLDQLQRMGYLD